MDYLLTLEVTGCHPPKTELEWRRGHLLFLLCARRGWNPSASSNQTVQTISQRITKVKRRFDSIVAAANFFFKQMSAGGTSVVLKSIISIKLGDKCLWRAVRWQDNLWQKVVRRFNYEELTRSFFIYIRYREHFPFCHFSSSAVENLPGPRLALKSRAILTYIFYDNTSNHRKYFMI